MPFASPFGFSGALTDPPSLFGEIARMIKTISPESNFPDAGKKYEGMDFLIN